MGCLSDKKRRGGCRQVGVSLVELMVVLLLISILFAGVFHLYLNAKRQYRWLEEKHSATMQQWLLTSLLTKTIRGVAYNGCGRWQAIPPYDHQLKKPLQLPVQLLSHDSLALAPAVKRRMMPESQALRLMQLSANHSELAQAMQTADQLLLKACPGVKPNSLLMVSDCRYAEVVLVKAVSQSHQARRCLITVNHSLNHRYDKGSVAGAFFDHTLYIGKTMRKDTSDESYALYIKPRNGPSDELSEHVKAMRFQMKSKGTMPRSSRWQLEGVLSSSALLKLSLLIRSPGRQGHAKQVKSWDMMIQLRNVT